MFSPFLGGRVSTYLVGCGVNMASSKYEDLPERVEKVLRRIYTDPKSAGAFGGVQSLLRQSKKEGLKVNKDTVKNFLEGQDAYTKHGRIIASKKGVLNERIITSGPYDLWEADLMDYPKSRPQQRTPAGLPKYILTVVDAFTKNAWVEPLLNKNGPTMVKAFTAILDRALPDKVQLDNLRTDAGTEFFNRGMKALYTARGINHYRAQKEPGASIVERFNRTLGEKLARYATHNPHYGQRELVDVLPQVVEAYNNTTHSATKTEPTTLHEAAYTTGGKGIKEVLADLKKDPSAGRDEAEAEMMAKFMSHTTAGRYKDPNPLDPVNGPAVQDPLPVGTAVRVNVRKNMFEKGRAKNFSDEVWTVKEAGVGGNPNAYALEDDQGEPMVGKIYRRQLQRLSRRPNEWEVTVLRRRHLRGRDKEIQVQWVGHPHLPPQWIAEKDIV